MLEVHHTQSFFIANLFIPPLSAFWGVAFRGPVSGVDYSPLANTLFAQVVGVSKISDCEDVSKFNLQRTFAARFNTPKGPETRVFSVRDLKTVFPRVRL